MIEIVYKENPKEGGLERKLNLPKNVRQIGEPEENRKIYIEDYVMTYLRRFAKETILNSRGAILLGKSERMDGIPYLFIKSAIALKGIEGSKDGIPFTDDIWAKIYETIKEYFADQDILGWFLSMPGYPMELNSRLLKTHINYFGGIDKVLMIEEPLEGEEDFFAYENGRLTRQKGYYIFYEQNEAMQRYMVENGDGDSVDDKEDFDDRAVRNFRTVVQEKKEVSGQKRVMTFLYMASTFLVMVVLVIGITLINNYEKMEGLETTLSEISESLERQEGQTVEMLAKEGESQELVDAVEAENANVQTEEPQESEEPEVSEEPQDSQEPETSEEQAVEPETPSEEPEDAPEEQAPEEGIEAISQSVESIQEKYTVRKGDTLLKISMKIYGNADKIDDICQLNGIKNSDHILVGQKLLLP
ncbi:MAG: LysM peptidoglycan-binding domain-containing protein [Lachnospiraceae bacterium]|jgi:LysM repeat protein|nr:LysM peptidoglycan-binding domain-containing protein [Lachnospiraceae bacterium]